MTSLLRQRNTLKLVAHLNKDGQVKPAADVK